MLALGFTALYALFMRWSDPRQAGVDFTCFQCMDSASASSAAWRRGRLRRVSAIPSISDWPPRSPRRLCPSSSGSAARSEKPPSDRIITAADDRGDEATGALLGGRIEDGAGRAGFHHIARFQKHDLVGDLGEARRRSWVAMTMVCPLWRAGPAHPPLRRRVRDRAQTSARRRAAPSAKARARGRWRRAAADRPKGWRARRRPWRPCRPWPRVQRRGRGLFSFGHFSTVTSPSMTFSIAVRCGKSWKF